MKVLKRVLKWITGAILVLLLLAFLAGFIAYWRSTNDCGHTAAPARRLWSRATMRPSKEHNGLRLRVPFPLPTLPKRSSQCRSTQLARRRGRMGRPRLEGVSMHPQPGHTWRLLRKSHWGSIPGRPTQSSRIPSKRLASTPIFDRWDTNTLLSISGDSAAEA